MKRLIITLGFVFATLAVTQAGGTLACGGGITVTRDGKKNDKIKQPLELINGLQALLQSCSVDSSENANKEKWEGLLKSSSFIHYTLPKNLSFHLPLQGNIQTDVVEIIFPLPKGNWPDNVYVKNPKGYFAYCKYRPETLKKIVDHPEVGLALETPYNSLTALKETK